MSDPLPLEAEQYVVPGNVPESIRNLTAATERGEFGYSVISGFLRAVEKGRDPRFARTRPVPLRMKEAIEARPDLPPRQVIYMGLQEGLWSWEDIEAFEKNAEALSSARRPLPPRGVYLTRGRRRNRRPPDTGGQFVARMSLDAVCDARVCDGAKTCLAILLARAGKSDVLVTYTSSIATQMGRTPRTVRNHFQQLEEAGLIRREAGRHPNTVRITILPPCRPEPYAEPLDVKAFKLARRCSNPAIRSMADTVVLASWNAFRPQLCPQEGRKGISAFNPTSILDRGSGEEGARQNPRYVPPTSHSTLLKRLPQQGFGRARPSPAASLAPDRHREGMEDGYRNESPPRACSSSSENMALAWK